MNQHTTTPSPSPKPRLAWIRYLLAALLLLALLLWRELAHTRKSLAEVHAKNSALAENLKSTKAELDQLNSGDSSPQTKERLANTRQSRTSPSAPEAAETFVLQSPSVTQSADGLSVLLSFEPTTSEPSDSIALVVRVPMSSDGRIIAVEATDESLYADIKTHIDERGKFAVFQGTPADLNLLQINLTVSGPTKAMVRGTGGIKGFELDITPERVESRNL